MPALLVTLQMEQFVDDEMLRAPLLFDQVLDGTLARLRSAVIGMPLAQRYAANDLAQVAQRRASAMAEHFSRSLREQVAHELSSHSHKPGPHTARKVRPASLPLALVDEAEVAIDVELAHAIDCIKAAAEYEVRELQTYTAALVGDMEMARDHNPFRAETFARALWAAAQSLPLSRQQQTLFLHQAAEPLAAVLRQAYAASASRLESMGIEPAAYRTLVRSGGSRRDRLNESSFSPILKGLHAKAPAPSLNRQLRASQIDSEAQAAVPPVAARKAPAPAPAPAAARPDRETQALVGQLFDAIRTDPRVPPDVLALVLRLHGPALQLAAREADHVTEDSHAIWAFINRLAYEAEMTPDPADPERHRLLRLGQATIQQVSREPEQRTSLYTWALARLEVFASQRLGRRCSAAASQIEALQRLEDKLLTGQAPPTTLHGVLDLAQLDTVPAALMQHEPSSSAGRPAVDDAWLDALRLGQWVRMFIQGHWVHAQLLWPGERGEIWLFADGASDATWVVRRRALLKMKQALLFKLLTRRSLVRRAARTVQDKILASAAPSGA